MQSLLLSQAHNKYKWELVQCFKAKRELESENADQGHKIDFLQKGHWTEYIQRPMFMLLNLSTNSLQHQPAMPKGNVWLHIPAKWPFSYQWYIRMLSKCAQVIYRAAGTNPPIVWCLWEDKMLKYAYE